MSNRIALNQRDANTLNDIVGVIGRFNETMGWQNKSEKIREILSEHAPELVSIFDNYFAAAMIALIHSELSEALEGLRKGLMDDHITTRPMAEVEMADVQIRLLDFCNRMNYDLGGAVLEKSQYNAHREDHRLEVREAVGGKSF